MGRRNFQGGNKTKAMKKGSSVEDTEIITIQTEEHEYAIVTAVCGNGRFKVTSHKKNNYTAILPGSMRGSKKRNYYVEMNSILLINNRSSWQTIKPNATVDILHVYSQNHISHLKLYQYFHTQSNTSNDLVIFQNHDSILLQNDKYNDISNLTFDIDIINI